MSQTRRSKIVASIRHGRDPTPAMRRRLGDTCMYNSGHRPRSEVWWLWHYELDWHWARRDGARPSHEDRVEVDYSPRALVASGSRPPLDERINARVTGTTLFIEDLDE